MTAPRRGRILVLTPRFPYPVVGGDRLRIHAICRVLAKRHRLTLLSLYDDTGEADPALVDDTVFERIERVHLPRWRSILQTAAALPRRTPLQVAYYRSHAFAERIAALLPEHDLVLAHLIRTADYVAEGSEVPTVIEMTDAISMNYARVRAHGARGIRGRVYAIEQKRLEQYERAAPGAFDLVSLIAQADVDYLWASTPPANVVVASNGVDCDALAWRDRSEQPAIAVYIGNMYSAQNMDACRHFVSDILPLLSTDDLAEFRVVGRIRESDAAWLRARPRVTVTGEIASVAEAVRDTRLGVCPVRLGAGVQNKVLEYMALGLPVVCSPIGHEGIAARDGTDLLVARDSASFADAIRRINADRAFAALLSVNGRSFVERHHGWGAVLAPLLERVEALLPD